MSIKIQRVFSIFGGILIFVAGAFFANAAKAQNREDVYIGIYKSTNLNESREISSRTTSPSKLIRWISTNEWIVGLGPYYSAALATTAADEIARDYKSKTGQEFPYLIFRFRANTSDDQLTSQNIINSTTVQQQAATTSNTIQNEEWIKEVEFNGSKPGIRVHLLYGRMKRDGDLLQVSNLYNYFPNALGDENAKESVGSGQLESSSSPARSRLVTEIINCKSSNVATIKDDAYSKHWGEGRVVLGAFSSRVVKEPGPFAKADIDFFKKVCSISNLPQDKSLSQQWGILESNSVARTTESLKWNQFICDGKYTQITKNIVIKRDAAAQAGFAYSKSNDRLLVELAGVYDRMAASTSETIPNFSTSAVIKSSTSVSGFYRQTNSPVSFNASFDLKGQMLQIAYSIGGVQTTFVGKCRSESFL
jgi:hypothetical protein